MIKAINGKKVILGLSEINIIKLQEGFPISLNLKDLGLPDQQIFIFAGKDEKEMGEELRKAWVHE